LALREWEEQRKRAFGIVGIAGGWDMVMASTLQLVQAQTDRTAPAPAPAAVAVAGN
jgi:hypothetical protein